jgi:hypothetical protein
MDSEKKRKRENLNEEKVVLNVGGIKVRRYLLTILSLNTL